MAGYHSWIVDCLIRDNTADYAGGAIYCYADLQIVNSILTGNSADYGGGVFNGSGSGLVWVCNSTITANTASVEGGGIYDELYVYVDNCILWADTPDEIVGWPDVRYSDVQGGWPGHGNIDADPLFVDPNNADFRLSAASPCIDAADSRFIPADVADLDGDGDTAERTPLDLQGIRRFVDRPSTVDTGVPDPPDYPQVVDMGAYEFGLAGDTDGDCDVDQSDLAQLLANYGTTSGMGYEDGNVDGDGDVDLADLAALLAVYGTTCP